MGGIDKCHERSHVLCIIVVGCTRQRHYSFCINSQQRSTDPPIGTQVLTKVGFVDNYATKSCPLFLESLLLDKELEISSNARRFSFASFLEKVLSLSFLSPAMNDE